MSKVLLFSDIHIFPHKKSISRLEDCIAALNWVFDVAAENSIKNILFGGDFFHDRQKIEVYTYQRAFETLKNRLNGNVNLYLLLGNHDIWFNDNTSFSSVVPLTSLPGVKIIANPERIKIEGHNWDFVPFTHNPIHTLEKLKEFPGNPEYALGHISLDGAILHGTQQSDVIIEHDGDMTVISPSLFDHYKYTFLGHYHAEQKVNKQVEYIGSPLELNFGEAYQEKHIIIFDGDKGKKQYIKNDFSPRHLVIDISEKDKYDLNHHFVQIKVNDISSTDIIALKKELSENNKLGSLQIKQNKNKMDEHLVHDAKAILYKGDLMLEKYLEEVGCKGLERDKLLNIGKEICQKIGVF
jgi:DNA repair exonuclease SbcCD nuclease subunit